MNFSGFPVASPAEKIIFNIKLRGRPPTWRGGVRILLEHQAPGEEGLQSNGPKAVLDTGVVFGRSYGAASTTLSGKTFEKTHANQKENITKSKAELRAPPMRPRVTKKHHSEPKDSPGEPKATKRTARERPRDPRGTQRLPKDRRRPPKMMQKLMKN